MLIKKKRQLINRKHNKKNLQKTLYPFTSATHKEL